MMGNSVIFYMLHSELDKDRRVGHSLSSEWTSCGQCIMSSVYSSSDDKLFVGMILQILTASVYEHVHLQRWTPGLSGLWNDGEDSDCD
jgi:hypothetical protein